MKAALCGFLNIIVINLISFELETAPYRGNGASD